MRVCLSVCVCVYVPICPGMDLCVKNTLDRYTQFHNHFGCQSFRPKQYWMGKPSTINVRCIILKWEIWDAKISRLDFPPFSKVLDYSPCTQFNRSGPICYCSSINLESGQ